MATLSRGVEKVRAQRQGMFGRKATDIVKALAVGVMLVAGTNSHGFAQDAQVAQDAIPGPSTLKDLVVHEWGVTIHDPNRIFTQPAANESSSGLPSFEGIVDHENLCHLNNGSHSAEPDGWKKPVLWFYGTGEGSIQVDLKCFYGNPTADFPLAKIVERPRTEWSVGKLKFLQAGGFEWKGTLSPKPRGHLPNVDKSHWWQIARDAGGLYANIGDSSERFIFYEGSGFEDPTVTATVASDSMTILNGYNEPSGQVVLLVNTGSKHYAHVINTLGRQAKITLTQDDLVTPISDDALLATCAAQWKSFGMTIAEGTAISQIWKDDLLKPGRMMLISRMPPDYYDDTFMLEITPKPSQLVRVGLVFDVLNCQQLVSAWVPELRLLDDELKKAGQDLADSKFQVRNRATTTLRNAGERARGLLQELTRSQNTEVKYRAAMLLAQLDLAEQKLDYLEWR